jgi:hypothetical protein
MKARPHGAALSLLRLARRTAAAAGPACAWPKDGGAIDLEVWSLPTATMGSVLRARFPAPLGLGSVALEDGSTVLGFLCESYATAGAQRHHRAGRLARLSEEHRLSRPASAGGAVAPVTRHDS